MMAQTIAASATRPMVRPTAAPVLSPLLLFLPCVIPTALPALGGVVGVTVTVRTWPVTVSRDVTGVGVHVEDELLLVCDEVVRGVVEVSGVDSTAADVGDVELVEAATELAPSVPDGATFKAIYPYKLFPPHMSGG